MNDGTMSFRFEWEPGENVRSPELAATWANLQIWAGSECVTTVEDLGSASARRSIYCSLYPIAEWVAFNWWYLLANQRPAVLEPPALFEHTSETALSGDAVSHHVMRSAGDGFIYPRLAIVPQGESVRLMWSADSSEVLDSPIRYLSSGNVVAGREEVVGALTDLVEAVLTRLREQGVVDSALEREWTGVRSVDSDEREFCVAAARLGLDAYSIDPRIAKVVEKANDMLDRTTRDELFDAAQPSAAGIASALVWIKRASDRVERWHGGAASKLSALREELPSKAASIQGTPWAVGYEQARLMRSSLGVSPRARLDPDTLLASGSSKAPGPELQGFGGISAKGAPALILDSRMKARSARFAEARALWHFTYGMGDSSFLLTAARGERQQAERAFAAELLAPVDGLRSQLGREPTIVSEDEVDTLAEHFRVSQLVIGHQLENQLGATVF